MKFYHLKMEIQRMMKLEQLNLYVLSLRMPLVLIVFQTSIFWPSYHFCFSNLVSGLCWFAACTSFDSFSRLFCLLHSCCLLMTICFSTEHTAILFLWVLTFYLFDWVHEPNFLFFGWAIGMLRIGHLNFFFFWFNAYFWSFSLSYWCIRGLNVFNLVKRIFFLLLQFMPPCYSKLILLPGHDCKCHFINEFKMIICILFYKEYYFLLG